MSASPKSSHHYACVLAGGSGERFWPMSRSRTPKHLLRLLSDRTLLEETVRRLDGVVPPENIFVLTNAGQLAGVRAALPDLPAGQVVAEPARRDTGPAAALATGLVHARDPKGVVALLPADAFISDRKRFAAQLKGAFDWASGQEALLTFAVPPTYPATGFGYLELGEELGARGRAGVFRKVRRFVEKPDGATARRYVKGGHYAWNAGMFVWRTGVFLSEADRHAPALAGFVRDFPRGNPAAYLSTRFPELPKISIDYALMEKAGLVATLVAEFDWDDVGTWTALRRHFPSDASGNAARGPLAAVGSTDNITVSNGRLIALCGVKDLVVVETEDAILVCHRDAVQEIKHLHPKLPPEVR
jgi:mannose-1-phosphate guanylyltransferase